MPLDGAVNGWDDWHNADQWVQLYPGDLRFVAFASDWPRVEGPADFTTTCSFGPGGLHWDWCSIHFTEMKLGNVKDPAQSGGTWFFHGTMEAGSGALKIVTGSL
jgi:hypothetical protein